MLLALLSTAACSTAAAPRPTPTATATVTVAPARPALDVPERARAYFFGDSWAEGQVARRGRGFPYVTGELLGWTTVVDGVGSTGYLSHWRPSTQTYPVRASAIPAGTAADVVILEGGLNDRSLPLAGLKAAVRETITTLRTRFRGAPVVVLGPMPNALPVPESLRQVDRLIEEASSDAGAPYVSPIQREWITGLNFRDVIDAKSQHPTTAGHAYLGGRLAVALQKLMTTPQGAGTTPSAATRPGAGAPTPTATPPAAETPTPTATPPAAGGPTPTATLLSTGG